MRIVLLVEGDTEAALKGRLKEFLDERAQAAGKPRVRLVTRQGIVCPDRSLARRVELELRRLDVVGVVGLIDVFPRFRDAEEAKACLRMAANHPQFHAHAAQFDVEAWLLPYWADICRRVGVRQAAPGKDPETVDEQNPPAYRLESLYQLAKPKRHYSKAKQMYAILKGKDLTVSAARCPEFKAFLNTLLTLGGLEPLP